MSEVGGGSDGGMDVGSTGEVSSGAIEGTSSSNEEGTTETDGLGENLGGSEVSDSANISEVIGDKGMESMSITLNEAPIYSKEITDDREQIFEIPETLEQAQEDVEAYHHQSLEQILETNGKYMSESDRDRVANGVDNIYAIEHNVSSGRTGGYLFSGGKSNIEVSAMNQQQMERSTKHETNHFASKNREIIVPEPDKKGYTVYQTVGMRQSSWFHSNETGLNSNFTSKGRGLNEGLTTMYTNQQLTELSKEKGEAAERQEIYSHATELCNQLEVIVGKDTLKEAYYGGNLQGLEEKVDALAGEKGFESLRDCLDRTLSKDYAERVQAMKEAQTIMAKMYEEGERKV